MSHELTQNKPTEPTLDPENGDGEIVISMMQLLTQKRSKRIGRENQISESYLNPNLPRAGAAE